MKDNKREIEWNFDFLKQAKRRTIHTFMNFGKKHPVLKYPMFAVTVLFIFIYNMFLHLFIQLHMREKLAKGLAFAMSVILVLTSIDITAFAMSGLSEEENLSVITGFEELDENILLQKLAVGDSEEKIQFPDMLRVTIVTEETTSSTPKIDSAPTPEAEEMPSAEESETPGAEETPEVTGSETPEAGGTPGSEETENPTTEVIQEVEEIEASDPGVTEEQSSETPEAAPEEAEPQQENVEESGENFASRVADFFFPAMTVYAAEEENFTEEIGAEQTEIAVSWILDMDRSSREAFSSEQAGDAFVYVPVLPDGYGMADGVSAPEIWVVIEDNEQASTDAFDQSTVLNGIEISVNAPAGVFPAGASLDVKMITNASEVSEIEQLVSEKKDETTAPEVTTVVEQSYSFDITIRDENGTEIEPDTSKGQVSVTFKNVGVIETEQQDDKELSVFYVSDDYREAEELSHDTDISEDSASITAEHFSIYTVVITTETKEVILPYYQATSKAASYFTVYNEEQLIRYRDLLNAYVAGTVTGENEIATILVNADDANPMDGITGLGQATNMTVRNLNFNVKIMDDITVQNAWSSITKIPSSVTFDGAGHEIVFLTLAPGTTFSEADCTVLAAQNDGVVKHVTLRYGSQSYTAPGETETGSYATVTVRLDGQKAEIGEAITGAEALAASCDGINYITLERSDDLSVYRTPLENLEEGKEYHVYYVYEDENETISAAVLTKENYEAELNYVSVTYDLEGANTYKLVGGELSENVMAAIRVDVLPDGSYKAQEDYEAVVKAVSGYEIPTREKNVTVKVGGISLVLGTDYTYTYDADTKLGTIHINRDKITGPVSVKVKADSLEDNPPNTIILKTRGGSISDPLWEKTTTATYTQSAYEDMQLPTIVSPIKGSDAIRFAGWYTNMNCTGAPVNTHTYAEGGATTTYYAKWVLNKPSSENGIVYYEYKRGALEVQGRPNNNDSGQVTFGYNGFHHSYTLNLSSAQANGNAKGTGINMVSSENNDAFVQISGTNIWVAMVCTLEGSLVDITYIFENRGSSTFSSGLYFGTYADVEIADDDGATIAETPTSGGVTYMSMTSRAGTTHPNKQFRLYTRGTDFGIDAFYSYWYGSFGNHANKVFTNSNRETGVGDSALAFSWYVNNIPVGGYVTKTTKMGLADVSTMSNITAALDANDGIFADGKSIKKDDDVTSNQQKITINANGTLTVVKTTGNVTVQPPTRIGYKFDHWSVGAAGGPSCAGKTFTESVTLYANWIPQPDKSVTNNCSVQKVNGSSNLLVPEALGNIVIQNTTPGATTTKIYQGQTATEAAGYASGFSCVLVMEGEDDRYLLPDNIEVTITDENGVVTKLTKDTGYVYSVYDNRRKADLEIRRQYINGNVTITAVGYELPPVTATEVSVMVPNDTVSYGDRAVFSAHAETSKNHVASYQWYIAPYYDITLDNKTSWTYQNQDGIALTNGTYVCDALNTSGNSITVTGANKATLRISGLDVNRFSAVTPGESMDGLRFGGYHVYCVVTSTRNITGQEIVAVSDTAELQVVTAQYAAPDGIEGSATTYYGSPDGTIAIAAQENRPKLFYKKSTGTTWSQVTDAQIEAGEITGLTAGTYEFKYVADSNHTESSVTRVVVENGRYIVVTYRAAGCDDAALRTQYKHVAYGSNVTAATPGLSANDVAITGPARTGYTFAGWDRATISNITSDTTVNAVYTYGVYKITLDNQGASNAGTAAIYEKYSAGFYQDSACTTPVTGATGITIPVRDGYNFLGYYTSAEGGTRMLNADGCLSENMSAAMYLANGTLYAHWKEKPVDFNVLPGVDNPSGGTSGGDTPGSDPENDVEISIKPSEPVDPDDPDNPGTGEEDPEYHANTSYDVTVTNHTGAEANVIYIYSNGVLKKTRTNVIFDENNQYTFTLIPSEVGGGTITFAVGYVSPVTDEGTEKTEEEIKEEAEQQAADLNYTITYKEVNGTLIGTDFSGTFLSTAPVKGVKGVATVLPGVTKTGYTFAGWYTAPRGTGRALTEIAASNTSDEVVVYAKWIANKYTITLRTNGGTYTDGYTPAEQYQHDSNNIVLPDDTQISKENYVFLGWFDNAELTGDAIREVDASQVGGVTYYAGWELLSSHTVTLAEDGMDGQQYVLSGTEGYGYVKDGIIYVYDGKSYQFTVSVASAYKLKAVKANGKLLTGTNGVYTIPSVTDDITITVTTEQLVSTDTLGNVAATILLSDGTTGYFKTIADAINYAANYGTHSVIQLQKDFSDLEIDAKAGTTSYSIDLNGHTVDGGSALLIEDGAVVALKDSVSGASNEANELNIENRGTFTNDVIVTDLLNLGITINNGKVLSMTQQDSEYYEKSKFVNNGTVESANLEHGYFVENVQEGAPAGLTGYHTIMNGNEYYVDFRDAVDIANASASDATILILSTVDNRNSEIHIENRNGKMITVDLNGCNLAGGTLVTGGTVGFVNGKGSATCISDITSAVDNTGDLTIGAYIKISGAMTNEEGAHTKVEEKAAVSGPVTNKGDFENDGDITGIYTNESGHTKNSEKGTMNNVVQKGGDFDNDGDIKTKLELEGGSYTPSEGATPEVPEGAVAKSNTNPVTYYGTFKDAVEDANDPETSGAEGQEQPFTITLIKDVSDEDLGEAPIVLNPDVPVNINLNNHKLGDEDSDKGIQIGNPDGGESSGQTVTIQNQPENGDPADPAKGNVNTPMKVEDGGSLDVDKGVSLDDVDNDGKLKVEEGGTVEKLSNQGDTENDGTLRDTTQNGGNLKNGETGQINKLTQNGGNTDNQGEITEADMNGGGYTGTDPETITGVDPSDETDGKVAKIMPPGGGEPIYFVSLDDALEYAAGMDNGPVTVELLKDVTDENIDLTTTKTPVNLDLKGHSIKPSSSITTEAGTDLTIRDTSDGNKGKVEVPVTNNGRFTNKSEISGPVINHGDFDNQGKVTGDVAQKGGTYTNEEGATTKKITQTGGETINKDTPGDGNGGIEGVDLQRGSYEGTEPTSGIDNEAKIGNKLYGDLESAIEDANKSDENVTIELTKDVELPDTPPLVIDNKNGHTINIDLQGKDITGGEIQVGSGDSESEGSPSGNVTFTDSSTPGEDGQKGTINSDIKVQPDGDLTIGEDVTTTGDVDNAGKTTNNGTIKDPGTVTNTGNLENHGDIETKVEQKEGTFTNGEDGKVREVEQTGGTLDNKNPNGIEKATVSDGEFKGDPATNMKYEGAKVAVITQNPDGTTKTTYYSSIEEALKETDGNVTLQLMDDVKGDNSEDILINKPGIALDLNGHEIGTPSKLTIDENGTDIKLTDSSEGGKVTAPIDNKGNLTIDEGVKAESVSNSGTLNNEGEITTLTNNGDATNRGTIGTVKQKSGNMQNDGTIQSVEFTGGGYEGEKPETPIENPVAKIGDKLYADLESAIEDANKASEDVTIEILKNTTIPETSIGNENGKIITVDLGGNTVGGGPLTVKAPGVTEITDSSEQGDGSLQTNVKVDPQAKLVVDESANVDGNIENQGTTKNEGHVGGNITNKSGGNFINDGDIAGNVKNEDGGNFANRGENSYIGGDVENAGDMINEGVISGEVDNTGDLDNSGNIDNNVTNRGNGKLDNDGNINGQLENKDNSTTDNSGSINQVKQSGGELTNDRNGNINEYLQTGGNLNNGSNGTIGDFNQTGGQSNNEGRIEHAEVSDMDHYSGNLPKDGLDGVEASVTYVDENGNKKTEYCTSLKDALERAEEKNKPVTITPASSSTVIDEPISVPEGVTLHVPDGKNIVIRDGGSLEIQGDVHIQEGGSLTIQEGGSLNNSGNLNNDGTVNNNGNLTNGEDGNIKNTGDISNSDSGALENNGTIDNRNGSLNGDSGAGGNTVNNGKIVGGNVTGPLENNEAGIILESDKLSGDITNKGKIELYKNADTSDATIENLPGSSYLEKVQPSSDSGNTEQGGNDDDAGETGQKPSEVPESVVEEAAEEILEEETTITRRPATEETTEKQATEETVEDGTEENPDSTNTGEEELPAEKPVITIQAVEEGAEIAVKEDVEIVLQEGRISLQVSSQDGSMTGMVDGILMSCFSEKEIEQIKTGTNAEVRVTIVKIREEVPKQDAKVMQKTYERYAETVEGLQFGQYVDIMIETRLGDGEWKQVHELNGEVEITLNIPEELLGNGRTYFVMRNHNGKCTLLEDLDDSQETITITTDQFSTYAILYTDAPVDSVDLAALNQTRSPLPWILLVLAVLALGMLFLYFGRRRRKN